MLIAHDVSGRRTNEFAAMVQRMGEVCISRCVLSTESMLQPFIESVDAREGIRLARLRLDARIEYDLSVVLYFFIHNKLLLLDIVV